MIPRRILGRCARALGLAIAVFASGCGGAPPAKITFDYPLPAAAANATAPRIAVFAVADGRVNRDLDRAIGGDLLYEVRRIIKAELLSTGLFADVEPADSLRANVLDGTKRWRVDLALLVTNVQLERDGRPVAFAPRRSPLAAVAALVGLPGADPIDAYGFVRVGAVVTDRDLGRTHLRREYLGTAVHRLSLEEARDPNRRAALLARAMRIAMAKFKGELIQAAGLF